MGITTLDHALIRSGQQHIKRYMSVMSRAEIFSAVVTEVIRDEVSSAIIAIEYSGATGDYTDIEPGMTLDIGWSANARDVGSVRIRDAATSDTIPIAETSYTLLPIDVGHYITARVEFGLHRVLPRGVGEKTGGATYTNDLTLYMDYDNGYSDQNESPPPKANITRSATSYFAPKPADFVADSGYRTVVLSSAKSEAYNSKTIAARLWAIGDCTLDTGFALTDTTITILVPPGSRYIKLTVTDSDGKTGLMRYPIWAHDDSFAPLTNFKPTSDDSDELGTTMSFEFFGDNNSIASSVLPKNALICYWEKATFQGLTPPDLYRDGYLGWVHRTSTTLKINGLSTHRVETAGVGWWLNNMGGSSLYIYDTGTTPTKWYEMQNINCDRIAYFILKWFTNALELCNFFGGTNTNRSKGEEIALGDVWQQVNYMLDGYKGVAIPDSLNGIWVKKRYFYKNQSEKTATPTAADMTSADLENDSGFVWSEDNLATVSQVIGGGSTYDGETQTLYASASPLAPGYGNAVDNSLAVRLSTSDPQGELNDLTGIRRAEIDNPNRDLTIDTLLNFDVFEMCTGETIYFSYAHPNIAGLSVAATLVINRISRRHGASFGDQAKSLSIGVDVMPAWARGDTKPVVDDSIDDGDGGGDPPVIVLPPPIDWTGGDSVPSGSVVIAYFCTDNYVYITRNYRAVNPVWSRYALSVGGSIVAFTVDAYSPLYLGTGTTVNGWIATTTKIYKIEDIFGARTLTESFSFRSTSSLRSMDFSYGAANRGAVVTNYADGVYETHTSNGTSWSTEALVGGFIGSGDSIIIDPAQPLGAVASQQGQSTWRLITNVAFAYYPVRFKLASGNAFTATVSIVSGSLISWEGTESGGAWYSGNWPQVGYFLSTLPYSWFRFNGTPYADNVYDVTITSGASGLEALQPGAFLGSSQPGLAYTTALNGSVQGGYKDASTYGAGFALDAAAWGNGSQGAGDIYAGYSGEGTLFYGATVSGERRLYRRRSGIDSDVSPSYGGAKYGPWQSRHQVYIHPLNSSIVICVGGNADQSLCGVWVSRDEGATWTNIVVPSSSATRIERATFSGDNPDTIYLYGKTGKNYISTDFGATIKERTGNIAQMSSVGTFVNLCGGA